MNGLLAALMFFTRLPLWRWVEVPAQEFKRIVSYWSTVAWLTGGMMAIVFWLANEIMPVSVAVVFALLARLILTGALHEDGLADFFDGFGGGVDRESTLRIMKDSHIGGYGVLSLVFYYLLAFAILTSLPVGWIPFILFAGDSGCKAICSFVLQILPYARKTEESKAKIVYERLSPSACLLSFGAGLLPSLLLPWPLQVSFFGVVVGFAGLVVWMKRRIGGYTGDCCGAMFLICEMCYWIGCLLLVRVWLS